MCEWINVKSKLPEINETYICYIKFKGISLCKYESPVYGGRKRWWYLANQGQVKNVTHWLKLEDPKD